MPLTPETAAWAFALPQPSVTHVPFVAPATTDHAVNAGDAAFAFALPEPTVTHTAAPTDQLVLSDSDDTGLEVVAKALLVASGPGTFDSTFYADSDRGGTDTPLDGELGLAGTETVISLVKRFEATRLVLNDNDNPAALDIGSYFDVGGAGNDLTIYPANERWRGQLRCGDAVPIWR